MNAADRPSTSEAFERWYATGFPHLRRFAHGLTRDPSLADDVVADVCCRVLARWDSIETIENLDGYVYRMVINQIRSIARQRSTRMAVDASSTDRRIGEHPGSACELEDLLARCLSVRSHEMVRLRYFEMWREPEIAAHLGVTRGTVATTLSRARVLLRLAMQPTDDELESYIAFT